MAVCNTVFQSTETELGARDIDSSACNSCEPVSLCCRHLCRPMRSIWSCSSALFFGSVRAPAYWDLILVQTFIPCAMQKNLARSTAYHYLAERHVTTGVALLIGMSAAHRGTMDPTVAKVLRYCIRSLLSLVFRSQAFWLRASLCLANRT
jgi:hypothetical protein